MRGVYIPVLNWKSFALNATFLVVKPYYLSNRGKLL